MRAPVRLLIAMRITARTRAWMFSSVTSAGASPKSGRNVCRKAVKAVSIGISWKAIPSRAATSRASWRVSAELKREGIDTPVTAPAPSASAAIAAVRAESMPPERPSATRWKRFLRT